MMQQQQQMAGAAPAPAQAGCQTVAQARPQRAALLRARDTLNALTHPHVLHIFLSCAQIIQNTKGLSLLRAVLPLLPAEMRKLFGDAAGNDFTFFVPSDAALRCVFSAERFMHNASEWFPRFRDALKLAPGLLDVLAPGAPLSLFLFLFSSILPFY
jgi:hypothetical protein